MRACTPAASTQQAYISWAWPHPPYAAATLRRQQEEGPLEPRFHHENVGKSQSLSKSQSRYSRSTMTPATFSAPCSATMSCTHATPRGRRGRGGWGAATRLSSPTTRWRPHRRRTHATHTSGVMGDVWIYILPPLLLGLRSLLLCCAVCCVLCVCSVLCCAAAAAAAVHVCMCARACTPPPPRGEKALGEKALGEKA
jgi:hypothetical protein